MIVEEVPDAVVAGRATPSFIVPHHLPLSEAPDTDEHADARDDGWTKVLPRPAS